MMRKFVLLAALAIAVALGCVGALAQQPGVQAELGQDARMQADAGKALNNKRLRGVTARVDGAAITLSGNVQLLADKIEAEKKIHRAVGPDVKIQNDIEVQGTDVPDQILGQKLAGRLSIDGLNPDRTAFEVINLSVQNGVVTLIGIVLQPQNKDWAIGEVTNFAGVKGLVDKLQVAPLSPNDDRVRRDVFRAIYGYPTFTQYGINPAKPIRIVVVNGNVTLVGVVDRQSDKEQAGIRANGVGGVFKVTNDLQVPGPGSER